jgi:hypothetical protein
MDFEQSLPSDSHFYSFQDTHTRPISSGGGINRFQYAVPSGSFSSPQSGASTPPPPPPPDEMDSPARFAQSSEYDTLGDSGEMELLQCI